VSTELREIPRRGTRVGTARGSFGTLGRQFTTMANPFGAMPADRSLAAYGCGFGAVILGATAPRVLSLANDRAVPMSVFLTPWWLSALFAAIAIVIAVRVTGLMLRITLVAFALNRFLSIRSVASVLSLGPVSITVLNGLFGCLLLGTAWPHASRQARFAAAILFALFAGLATWIGRGKASVIA
jgi:hypothetical protein